MRDCGESERREREGRLEEWNVAEQRLRISLSQKRETIEEVRVSKVGRSERKDQV